MVMKLSPWILEEYISSSRRKVMKDFVEVK